LPIHRICKRNQSWIKNTLRIDTAIQDVQEEYKETKEKFEYLETLLTKYTVSHYGLIQKNKVLEIFFYQNQYTPASPAEEDEAAS